MKYFSILLLFILVLPTPATHAASIRIDSQQCATSCDVALETAATADNDLVESIPQTINLALPGYFDAKEKAHIRFIDLNFDGRKDLIITDLPTSGGQHHHWLYEPSSTAFRYIGHTPPLTVDPLKRQLYSTSKDPISHAFVTTFFQIEQGKIAAILTEKAEPTLQRGIYKKSRYQIENGHARLLKVEFAYGASGH